MSNILMYKKTRAEIDDIPIREGNILFDTTNKNILVDDNGTRESFGGGSGSTVIDKTQAEYEALPPSKLTDGNIYHITDLDALPTTASTVSLYIDGTKSNVQEGFNTLKDNLNHFQMREVDGKAQYKLESEGADAWRFFSIGGDEKTDYSFYATTTEANIANFVLVIANASNEHIESVSSNVATIKDDCELTFHMIYYCGGTNRVLFYKNGVETAYSGNPSGHDVTVSFNKGDTFYFQSGPQASNYRSMAVVYVVN